MQNDIPQTPAMHLRVLRIIVVALAAGLAVFVGIGLEKHAFGVKPIEKGVSPLALAAFPMLVGGIVIGLVVPRIMIKTALAKIAQGEVSRDDRQVDSGEERIVAQLLPIRMTTMIIKMVVLEAPGYAAAMAYFNDKDVVGLVIAVTVVVAILLHFPTATGLQKWLDQQAEAMTKIV